jgi:hypothetical protein
LDRLLGTEEDNDDEERLSSQGDDFHDHIDTSYRYSFSGRRIRLAPIMVHLITDASGSTVYTNTCGPMF